MADLKPHKYVDPPLVRELVRLVGMNGRFKGFKDRGRWFSTLESYRRDPAS